MIRRTHHAPQSHPLAGLALLVSGCVLGLGLYRMIQGQWTAALTDIAVAGVIGVPGVYARVSGKARQAGIGLAGMSALGCLIAGWTLGPVALYWHYLVLVSNYFIAPARVAVAINTASTAGLVVLVGPMLANASLLSMAVSGALVSAFTYVFTTRLRGDPGGLEQTAALDPLTGIPNRRAMEASLAAATRRQAPAHARFGLILLEIDHFKQVNDSFGRAAGDALLEDFADILKRQKRRADRLFRVGGEEFLVLVEVGGVEDLWIASERIRLALRSSLWGPEGLTTVSAGAALLKEEIQWREWLSQADAALHRAKIGGRDQTVLAGPGDVHEGAGGRT